MKEYEKYDEREKDIRIGMCRCGHYWHDHTRLSLITIITIFAKGSCSECKCPMYRRHHRHRLFVKCECGKRY